MTDSLKDISKEITDSLNNPDPQTVVIKPRYENKALQATHWMVNYIGIGWIVNAVLSIKIYDALKKNTQVEQKGAEALTNAATKIIAPFAKLSAEGIEKTHSVSSSFMLVALMGIGGFAVTPLQKLYGTFQNKIGYATLKIKDKATGKTEVKEEIVLPPPELKHESLKHWVLGKSVGFFAACSAYIVLTHRFPKVVPAVSEKVTDALQKSVWSKIRGETVKKYVIEQYAAALSIGSLALVKPWLDKKYPPVANISDNPAMPSPAEAKNTLPEESMALQKPVSGQKHKDILAKGTKGFMERMDTIPTSQPQPSL